MESNHHFFNEKRPLIVNGLCIIRWIDSIIGLEFSGEVMDGCKSKHTADLGNRIFVLFDQFFALFQFQMAYILFWSYIQIGSEKRLKTGTADGKLITEIFHR